jgi:hypothetical protein
MLMMPLSGYKSIREYFIIIAVTQFTMNITITKTV